MIRTVGHTGCMAATPDDEGPPGGQEMSLLGAAWRRLAGDGPGAATAGAELLVRWGEPHRCYHTPAHLRATLRAVDVLQEEARDPDTVRYAVWFHDAVYAARPGQDEEDSAVVADRLLTLMGTSRGRIDEVMRLVDLTRTHRPAEGDADGKVLCDADLSVLAGAPVAYRAYTEAVRAEYNRYSDEEFRTGRIRVLRSLLAAPQLFHTDFARGHWEVRARQNMNAEIERLSGHFGLPGTGAGDLP